MRSIVLSEWFRPWDVAGVTAFLAPDLVELKNSLDTLPSQTASSYPQQASSIGPRAGFEPSAQAGAGQGTGSSATRDTSFSPSREQSRAHPQRAMAHTNVSAERQVSSRAAAPAPREKAIWSENFKAVFQKISPAPVLWTYEQLGNDLSGHSDPARSACLKSLIQTLALPRGTSVFWPMSLPGPTGLEPNYPVFREGVTRLRPQVLVLIGTSALAAFEGEVALTVPFTQQIVSGSMAILLPEFSQLLSNPGLVGRSCVYLKAALVQLGVL